MCLLAWRWSPDTTLPLLWAANRDEFAHRATAPLQCWKTGNINVYSGLDQALDAHNGLLGTWSGITNTGRFAWLTNIRSPLDKNPQAPSRGHLISQYLAADDDISPADFITHLRGKAHRYNGFNVVVGRISQLHGQSECWHYNSRSQIATALKAGVYGLSNATLDSPWPKTRALVQAVAIAAASMPQLGGAPFDGLFEALAQRQIYPSAELPMTGLPIELEQTLSAAFIAASIRGAEYGTRSSTVGWANATNVRIEERSFNAQGAQAGKVNFEFEY